MELRILRIKEASGEMINSPKKIVEAMTEEAGADRECFWVLHLDNTLKVIEKELVAIGSLNTAVVHPREVFKKAIINSAMQIATVHNHPSGNAEPSPDDMTLWARLREVGELLLIPVMDNIIITPGGKFYSERESQGK